MASNIILTDGLVDINADCNVLKSEEYSLFLESSNVLDSATLHAEKICKQAESAYEERKQQGYEEGLLNSKVEQAEQMLNVVSQTINYLAGVEQDLSQIMLSGIRKIIGEFDDEKMTVSLIRNALQHVRSEKQVTVRIAPSHYSTVKEQLNEILADYKGVSFIDLVADQRLSTGDCVMESEMGVVDASIEVQITALQKHFEKISSDVISSISGDKSLLGSD